jgi:hypothetical protein
VPALEEFDSQTFVPPGFLSQESLTHRAFSCN